MVALIAFFVGLLIGAGVGIFSVALAIAASRDDFEER